MFKTPFFDMNTCHIYRYMCHSCIASSMTLCPKPCQTFVRRCFSSSTSWIDECGKCFRACIHPCQTRTFQHSISLKSTHTIKFIWLILSTIKQNGDIVLDTLEFCYSWYLSQGGVATHCRCGGKYDRQLVANLLRSPTVKEFFKNQSTVTNECGNVFL